MTQPSHDLDLPASEPSSGPLELLAIAWRRKSLVLLGGIVGLVVGTLVFWQMPAVFQSTTRLLINKKMPTAIPVQGAAAYQWFNDDYLSGKEILKSEMIIGPTVEKRKLKALKTFAEDPNPVATIMGGLSINQDKNSAPVSATNILNLSFNGPVPEDCPIILTAITDQYKEFLAKLSNNSSSDLQKLIGEFKQVIETDLVKKRDELRGLQEKNPLLVKTKDGETLQRKLLNNMLSTKIDVKTQLTELKIRKETIQARLKSGESAAAVFGTFTGLDEAKNATPAKKGDLEEELWSHELKIEQLKERLAADHPQVRAEQKIIEAIRKRYADKLARATVPPEKVKLEIAANAEKALQVYLSGLEAKIGDLKQKEVQWKAQYEEEAKSVKQMAQFEDLQNDLSKKQTNLEKLNDNINRLIPEMKLTQNFGGYDARVIAPPGIGQQVAPQALPIFLMTFAGGLVLGLGLAWVVELSDKSFKNPDEIRRRLGLPVLGHVPVIVPDAGARQRAEEEGHVLDPALITYYRSKSVQAEAFRGVRTWLYFNEVGKKAHKVLQITSPNMGDGKSTIAANLAISIAQSGKSILIIDADFRRPRQHKLFGLTDEIGLASVMADQVELTEAIQQTAVPNLSLLPCGPRPANPAELLTSPRFKELLDRLKEQFDVVLVDTPPLLVVSDPGVVAPRVDGVLLTIRVSKNGRPDAERAKESLASVNANLLGVIVNGVGAKGKYGYGKSYYNYQYAYSYAYKYRSFEDYSDEGYYQEEEDVNPPTTNGHSTPAKHRITEVPGAREPGNGEANGHSP